MFRSTLQARSPPSMTLGQTFSQARSQMSFVTSQVSSVAARLPLDSCRDKAMEFARARPVCASFLAALAICSAIPVTMFLGFVLFSALAIFGLALVVEIFLVVLSGIVFLVVMSFVLAIAGGLTVPAAILWLGFNIYRGTPIDLPPFSKAVPATSSSNHSDLTSHKD